MKKTASIRFFAVLFALALAVWPGCGSDEESVEASGSDEDVEESAASDVDREEERERENQAPDGDPEEYMICSTEPCITISPRLLVFGQPYPGVAIEKSFVIKNAGGGTLEILDVSVTEDPAGNYEITPPFTETIYLEPMETETINVKLEISQPGIHEAKVEIVSNAENGRISVVNLKVFNCGGPTSMCVTPEEEYDFGLIDINNTATLNVSLESLECDQVSHTILMIRKIELDPPETQHFRLEGSYQNVCPLNPADIFIFEVVYDPHDPGEHQATLEIYNDAYYACAKECFGGTCERWCDRNQGGIDPYIITLSGRACAPNLVVEPEQIDFGELTVGHTASVAVGLSSDPKPRCEVQIEGINWQGYPPSVTAIHSFKFIDPVDVAHSLMPPGSFATFRVACTPSSRNSFSEFLEVHSNDTNEPDFRIPVRCEGVIP